MSRTLRRGALAALAAGACAAGAAVGSSGAATSGALPPVRPDISDYAQLSTSTTPPTEAQCESAARRCLDPQAIQSAYDMGPLYADGYSGQGETIAIMDAYGSDTMASDLHVFDQAYGLQPMCGEADVTCQSGMPRFSQLALQGSPATKAPPAKSNGTGLEDKAGWALEVALDVEHAHAVAPEANILLVTTPTAETEGVQGFPQLMAAEDYVVKHGLAQVISQSFAAAEESFGSPAAIRSLRYAFEDAAQAGVTVLAGSGDNGTANPLKVPVKNPATIPYPSVEWPASDPLVTSVGGTDLCTDPNATTNTPRTVVTTIPPPACANAPAVGEIAWPGSGGGYSKIFAAPAYQQTALPAGTAMRGVPDVAFQGYSHTGVPVYVTLPPTGDSGLICGSSPCSTGWYAVGGTSSGSPQWAGLIAIAAQIHGGGLGLINQKLYSLASDPTTYANDFYDVTVGNNQTSSSVPGYSAGPGWDPVTGLGTPNAAHLVPALAGP